MSSEFGKLLRISVFGQSHGRAIGVNIDGLPAGESIDLQELDAFLDRRKPGKSPLSTTRKESDAPIFLSGLEHGVTCGAPLCAIIENSDQHSSDYQELQDKPRPGHADYTAYIKWDISPEGSRRLFVSQAALPNRFSQDTASMWGLTWPPWEMWRTSPFPCALTGRSSTPWPRSPFPFWTTLWESGCRHSFWRLASIWTPWAA